MSQTGHALGWTCFLFAAPTLPASAGEPVGALVDLGGDFNPPKGQGPWPLRALVVGCPVGEVWQGGLE